jgi:glycosyltransferase involved in cell wall biosynthesis
MVLARAKARSTDDGSRRSGPTGARGLRVVMLLENCPYPQDVRVLREAATLTKAGHEVSVICPRAPGQPAAEELEGIHVRRFRAPRTPKGTLGYLWEYAYSMLASFVWTFRLVVHPGFDVVHAHNPPDTFVLIGGFYKLFHKRFIFDHHDLTPEMFAARFGRQPPRWVRLGLLFFERLSLKAADCILATNTSSRRVAIERAGIPAERITVVRNGPDLPHLASRSRASEQRDRPLTLGYLGEISFHDGVDRLLHAVSHLSQIEGRSDFVCWIAGTGEAIGSVRRIAEDLGIDEHVRFLGWLDYDEVSRFLETIDIGVEPAPSNPYNDRCTMMKVMEYMAFAKPTVAFDLPENRFSADGAALFVPGNDHRALARGILELMDDPARRRKMGEVGRARIERGLAWPSCASELVRAYERLAPAPDRGRSQG